MNGSVNKTTKYGTQPFYDVMFDEGYTVRSFAKACGRSVTIEDVKLSMHGKAAPTAALCHQAAKILQCDLESLFTEPALRDVPSVREVRSPRVYYKAEVS